MNRVTYTVLKMTLCVLFLNARILNVYAQTDEPTILIVSTPKISISPEIKELVNRNNKNAESNWDRDTLYNAKQLVASFKSCFLEFCKETHLEGMSEPDWYAFDKPKIETKVSSTKITNNKLKKLSANYNVRYILCLKNIELSTYFDNYRKEAIASTKLSYSFYDNDKEKVVDSNSIEEVHSIGYSAAGPNYSQAFSHCDENGNKSLCATNRVISFLCRNLMYEIGASSTNVNKADSLFQERIKKIKAFTKSQKVDEAIKDVLNSKSVGMGNGCFATYWNPQKNRFVAFLEKDVYPNYSSIINTGNVIDGVSVFQFEDFSTQKPVTSLNQWEYFTLEDISILKNELIAFSPTPARSNTSGGQLDSIPQLNVITYIKENDTSRFDAYIEAGLIGFTEGNSGYVNTNPNKTIIIITGAREGGLWSLKEIGKKSIESSKDRHQVVNKFFLEGYENEYFFSETVTHNKEFWNSGDFPKYNLIINYYKDVEEKEDVKIYTGFSHKGYTLVPILNKSLLYYLLISPDHQTLYSWLYYTPVIIYDKSTAYNQLMNAGLFQGDNAVFWSENVLQKENGEFKYLYKVNE